MIMFPLTLSHHPSKRPSGCDTWTRNGVEPQASVSLGVGVETGVLVFEKLTAVEFVRVVLANGAIVVFMDGKRVVLRNGARVVLR